MFKVILASIICGIGLSAAALAQPNQASPPAQVPGVPPPPALPPGVGPQPPGPNGIPGAQMPPMPNVPGARGPVGPQPVVPSPPQFERIVPAKTPVTQAAGTVRLISFLDSTAVYVQAFDVVLMIVAGIFCLRARHAPGLTLLAIACFISAIILLGFFLFGIAHDGGLFPQVAYIVARILAPFELLLFAVAIILVARANKRPTPR